MKSELLSFKSYRKISLSPVKFAGALRAACLERAPLNDVFEPQKTEAEVLNIVNNKTDGKILKPAGLNNENDNILKYVTLKDTDGKKVDASIIRCSHDVDTYAICVDKDGFKIPVCEMLMTDDKDCVFIDSIKRTEKYNEINGAGTELIKFAAETSIKKGYGGRVKLFAIASFPFYYKNNFRVERSFLSSERDAYCSYMARNRNDAPKSFPSVWSDTDFVLTEDMALALLNNERLYEKDLYETEYDKILSYTDKSEKHTMKVDVDFCETTNSSFFQDGNKEYIIQLIKRDEEQLAPVGALKIKLLKDDDNRKYFNVENFAINDEFCLLHGDDFRNAVKREILNTAEEKAKKTQC